MGDEADTPPLPPPVPTAVPPPPPARPSAGVPPPPPGWRLTGAPARGMAASRPSRSTRTVLALTVVTAAAVGALVVGAVVVLDLARPTTTVDPVTRRAVAANVDELAAELDDWWDAALRARIDDVPSPRLSDGHDGLSCDGRAIVVDDDLVDNAWVYGCREGLTIAYDPALFAGDLLELELTMSHEWGHVVQATLPKLDPGWRPGGLPVDTELQADCLSGAWYGDARSAEPLEPAVASVRAIGDLPGTSRDAPDAHGTPDERVAAFLDGYHGGPEECLD